MTLEARVQRQIQKGDDFAQRMVDLARKPTALRLLEECHTLRSEYKDGCLTVWLCGGPIYIPGTLEEAIKELPKALRIYSYPEAALTVELWG